MDVKIYANYGVLAHEKKPVYTTVPLDSATCSEAFYIIIPDTMQPYVTESGDVALILLDGFNPYLLREVLATDRNDMPVLEWIDKNRRRCRYLPGTYGA